MLNGIGEGQPFTLFGDDYPTEDGTCVRDYIHIYDLATGHLLALDALAKGRNGGLQLGNGKGYSVLQVVAAVEKVTGKEGQPHQGPRREATRLSFCGCFKSSKRACLANPLPWLGTDGP